MKTALWIVFGVLALCWTGMAVFSVQLTDWVLAVAASDTAVTTVQAGATWTAPAWLALWIDPHFLQALQQVWAEGLRWLAAALPNTSGLSAWVTLAIWIVWGLGSVCLLALFAFLHWLIHKVSAGPQAVHA